MTCPVHSLYL